jgi:response regulator RpfG family c-di-GMP phosphodiesterase
MFRQAPRERPGIYCLELEKVGSVAEENTHILLVDDEPQLLEVCGEALEDRGYSVLRAGNGDEALKLISANPVSLVITDLKMPRMNGMELLQSINERGGDSEVIFLTGYGTVENAVDCVRMGAADYMLKPFDIRELLSKVEKILAERKIRSEQNKISNLMKMLALTNTLTSQVDLRSLIKEFLLHVRETFSPDSMAMYLTGNGAGGDTQRIVWGRALKENNALRRWFKNLALRLMEQGKPKLLDPVSLKLLRCSDESGPQEIAGLSAMIVPVASSIQRTGVLVLLRGKLKPQFTLQDLQLLSVFSSQAASSFENIRAYRRLQDINMEIITSYVSAVEAKDIYTHGHSDRVSRYAVLLGEELGLDKHDQDLLAFASILHDIGKIGISDNLLNKPSPLNADEFAIMKTHPVVGRDILSRVKTLSDTLPVIYHHHEWLNGSGYPSGLKGNDIPFLARALSVIDGFEAMTSDRAYQKARPAEEAKRILTKGAGVQWDPKIVNAWFRVLDKHDLQKAKPAIPMGISSAVL